MLKSTYVIGNVINDNIERYLINGEKFSWSQLGADLLTVGLELFSIKSSAKNLTAAESQSWCFVAGTLVATEAGYKAIEEIEVGDTVLAENPETGEVAYKTVLETYENETNELVHVHVNGETISATPTHPFYVNQFGWTRAADLRAGDVLVLSNGEYVVVEFVQHEILENPVKVYNFEVEDFHTYFVGEVSVLVHNGCEKTRLPRTNGEWENVAGKSNWKSYNKQVNAITQGESIPFKNGRPDFSKWSKGSIKFNEGELTGTGSDLTLVYESLKESLGLSSNKAAQQWLKTNKLTPHHYSTTEIQLIPSDLHGNVPHIGSASDLRAMTTGAVT